MGLMKPRFLVAILVLVTIAALFLMGAAGRLAPAAPEVAAPEPANEPPGPADPVPGATADRAPVPVQGSDAPAVAAPSPSVSQNRAPESAPVAGRAGMIAAIDPETGRLTRPSRAQRAALTEAMTSAVQPVDEPAEVIALPGGGELVHVGERFMEYAVARVDSSGRIRTDCVPGTQVEARLEAPAPAAAPARVWEER